LAKPTQKSIKSSIDDESKGCSTVTSDLEPETPIS